MPVLDDSDYGAAAKDLRLASMSHAELYLKRTRAGAAQDKLAPMEHRAFAREFAQESPVKAAVSLPFAIPAYTAAKALGISKARSKASVEEMKQGFIGLAEGLFKRGKR